MLTRRAATESRTRSGKRYSKSLGPPPIPKKKTKTTKRKIVKLKKPKSPIIQPYQCHICYHENLTRPFFLCDHPNSGNWNMMRVNRSGVRILPNYKVCELCLRRTLYDDQKWNTLHKCYCHRSFTGGQYSQLHQLLGDEEYANFLEGESIKSFRTMSDLLWCPAPDCNTPYLPKAKNRCRKVICQKEDCGTAMCGYCGELYTDAHAKLSCEKYETWKKGNQSVKFVKKMGRETQRGKTHQCPFCGVWITKEGGCTDMKCQNCRSHFCFDCGGATVYYKDNVVYYHRRSQDRFPSGIKLCRH